MKYWYYQKFKSSKCFIFQGKTYEYFYHKHNNTWANERAVEIPIIWEILKENEGKSILEVGNMLSSYFSVNHDIVDKYETATNVINQDIVDFHPSKNYNLIVSISTLEHVGWDEIPRDPTKIFKVIENFKNLLTSKGICVFTIPIGYNNELDILLNKNQLPISKLFYLKRITKDNRWEEVKWSHISNLRYGSPFNYDNGLIIGIIEK